MRTAGLPNFRKLYGAYDSGLKKGPHRVVIQNSYDVTSIKGTKKYVLSTTNALGGSNYFLAWMYIVVGALSLIFSVVFAMAYKKKNSSN